MVLATFVAGVFVVVVGSAHAVKYCFPAVGTVFSIIVFIVFFAAIAFFQLAAAVYAKGM
jgi:hypothetical protein